jgi:TolB-like protein/DNA-binding winged helix-turn-helix (wHTH) protein/Flp pilus assembly protein TadD
MADRESPSLQRSKPSDFFVDDWRVSPSKCVLARGNETARLEPKAMDVLVYLAAHPNEVVTREQLERDVWRGAVVGYDAVTNTVIKLRKALGDDARRPRFIATIPKLGYQLIAEVTHPEDNGDVGALGVQGVPTAPRRLAPRKTGLIIGATLAVAMLGFITAKLWLWPEGDGREMAPASIVVLPFEYSGSEPNQEYLADGMTEDIITDLSRVADMRVIASNTSMALKGRQITPDQVGADLDVRFALKGSIRRLGDNLRANAQLIDTKTGFNVWAQRYDRKTTEIFAVQDEVTRSIVEALAVKMTSGEQNRLAKRATDNLKAYDYFLEGQRLIKVSSAETNARARDLYRKAIDLDPNYGRAYGALAVALALDFRRGWTESPLETLDHALQLANRAVALDNSVPQTYWALGFVHLTRKEFDQAEQAAARALVIAPNYADGYGLLSLIKVFRGDPAKAIELNDKAIRYNPFYSFEYLVAYGLAYYVQGDYDAAIEVLERGLQRNPNAIRIKIPLAASYIGAGRQDDAEWLAEELKILSPTTTVSSIEKAIPIAQPAFKQALLEDLRKAGIPE